MGEAGPREDDPSVGDRDELTLHEVAAALDVHYMTAYRYLRTGRLAGRRVGGQWRVLQADVDDFATARTVAPFPPGGRGRPIWSQQTARLRDRLVAGDEAGAWQVLESALANGAEPTDAYVRLLGPALEAIGDGWADGIFSVEDEHRATAVASRLVGRLGPRFARRGRHRGTVVLGAAPGDAHALPTALVADVLRSARYSVVDLGGSTPVESFLTAAANADGLRAVGISAATAEGVAGAHDVLSVLRQRFPDVPLLLGGPAVHDEASARAAGADVWAPDAAALISVLDGLTNPK